jgi:hypothetical protein
MKELWVIGQTVGPPFIGKRRMCVNKAFEEKNRQACRAAIYRATADLSATDACQ